MKKYTLKNAFTVYIDFENAKISSICKNDEIIFGDVCFYAVKLLNRKGDKRIIDASEGRFISFDGETALYSHKEMDVSVSVKENGVNLLWRIKVENKTDDLIESVELASFGVYNKLRDENGGKGSIIYPYNEGVEITDMPLRESVVFAYCEADYPSFGKYNVFPYKVSSQYMAYLLNGVGVYLGMHDEGRTPKHIDFRYYDNSIRMQMRVFCNVNYGENYEMPFDTVLEFFDGGWESACEIYRRWFESHLPCGLKKIADSEDLPSWYHESPIVVTYPVRGRHDEDFMQPNALFPYEKALPYLENISCLTDSKVMALLMHWEGTAPWAPPFVTPPYGGEEMFKKFVDKAHSLNMLVGVYGSGIGWTQQSKLKPDYNREQEYSEKKLERLMCSDTIGKIEGDICKEQRVGYDFCVSGQEIKKLFSDEWNKVCSYGVDYAQAFDQNHGGCGYFCYSDKHGHIPAPGQWIVVDSEKLIQCLKNNNTMFGCETATSEPFLSYLHFSDNRFELNYYIGLPIPMYSYVYHEYINNFMGNQVGMPLSHEEYSYPYRAAYSFIAGDMFTVVMTDKGEFAYSWGNGFDKFTDKKSACALLKNLNSWRKKGGKDFLHTGKMVKAVSFYCGKNKFVSSEGNDIFVDELLTSAFSYGGRALQFIVNYNSTPKTVSFSDAFTLYKNPEMTDIEKGVNSFIIPPLTAYAVEW